VFQIQLRHGLWAVPSQQRRVLDDMERDGWVFWQAGPNHTFLATGPHVSETGKGVPGYARRELEERNSKVHIRELASHQRFHSALNVPSALLWGGGTTGPPRRWSILVHAVSPFPKTLSTRLSEPDMDARTVVVSEGSIDLKEPHIVMVTGVQKGSDLTGSEEARIASVVRLLSSESTVLFLDAYAPAKSTNLHASDVVFRGPSSGHMLYEKYTPWEGGAGGLITVLDTGIDWSHCFFGHGEPRRMTFSTGAPLPKVFERNSKQKIHVYARVEYGDGFQTWRSDFKDSVNGHGTHVAGTVAGGMVSGMDACTGRALSEDRSNAGAQLLFVDVGNTDISSVHLMIPPSLLSILQYSYASGSRLHSASWGSTGARYTHRTRELDGFMTANDDYVMVVSAGNDGRDGPYSLSSLCASKNALCIGATSSSFKGWSEHAQAGDLWRTMKSPMDRMHVSSHPTVYSEETIAAFSSQGPTPDNRTKPDIVAPGMMISSSRARSGRGDSAMLLKMGTSMATAVVARAVSIVQWVLRTRHDMDEPSSALVRAIFLLGAVPVSGGVADIISSNVGGLRVVPMKDDKVTSRHEGFGRAFVGDFLASRVAWEDRVVVRGFEKPVSRCFVASTTGLARIAIAWTDPPAHVTTPQHAGESLLVNDLDLRVLVWRKGHQIENEDPDQVLIGNHGVVPDRRNNNERVVFRVQRGDLVRVIVSTAGAISVPRGKFAPNGHGQAYSIAWSANVLGKVPRKCTHECTWWDPEYECLGMPDSTHWSIGVYECNLWTFSYPALPDNDGSPSENKQCLFAEDVCPLGLARDQSTGKCRCFSHIPCGDISTKSVHDKKAGPHTYNDTHHFALCHPETGELSPCVAIGSVFAPVLRVKSHSSPASQPGYATVWTIPAEGWIVWIVILATFAMSVYITIWKWADADSYRFTRMALRKRNDRATKRLNQAAEQHNSMRKRVAYYGAQR